MKQKFIISDFIDKMSTFSVNNEGVTRLPFTNESKLAFDYIVKQMKDIGLKVFSDKYGTIQGHLAGHKKESIIIGSHYDSVINGGKYDGIVGIAVGLSIADYFISNNIKPEYSIDILALNDEEGVRFNTGFTSSKAITGNLNELNIYDKNNNETLQTLLHQQMYGNSSITLSNTLKDSKKFIEVHIEQGSILEDNKCDIGIVDSIVGIKRYYVTVCGSSGHAGTTPMQYRSDALVAASKMIYDLSMIPDNYKDMVLTVGSMNVYPNAINIIPSEVKFSIDVRSPYKEDLSIVDNDIRKVCNTPIKEFPYNILVKIEKSTDISPVLLDKVEIKKIEKIVKNYTIKYQHIHSGAGHDAQIFASHIPTSMLFVPSHLGYSHRPDEFTEIEYINKAVMILCDFLNKY